MKRQATDWKRKSANCLSDIGFRIYEELSKLNSKKTKNIQLENEQKIQRNIIERIYGW